MRDDSYENSPHIQPRPEPVLTTSCIAFWQLQHLRLCQSFKSLRRFRRFRRHRPRSTSWECIPGSIISNSGTYRFRPTPQRYPRQPPVRQVRPRNPFRPYPIRFPLFQQRSPPTPSCCFRYHPPFPFSGFRFVFAFLLLRLPISDRFLPMDLSDYKTRAHSETCCWDRSIGLKISATPIDSTTQIIVFVGACYKHGRIQESRPYIIYSRPCHMKIRHTACDLVTMVVLRLLPASYIAPLRCLDSLVLAYT